MVRIFTKILNKRKFTQNPKCKNIYIGKKYIFCDVEQVDLNKLLEEDHIFIADRYYYKINIGDFEDFQKKTNKTPQYVKSSKDGKILFLYFYNRDARSIKWYFQRRNKNVYKKRYNRNNNNLLFWIEQIIFNPNVKNLWCKTFKNSLNFKKRKKVVKYIEVNKKIEDKEDTVPDEIDLNLNHENEILTSQKEEGKSGLGSPNKEVEREINEKKTQNDEQITNSFEFSSASLEPDQEFTAPNNIKKRQRSNSSTSSSPTHSPEKKKNNSKKTTKNQTNKIQTTLNFLIPEYKENKKKKIIKKKKN